MKFLKLFFIISAILLSSNSNAQKVKLKKGKVIIDDKEVLSYEKIRAGNDLSLYTLSGDEIIFVKREVHSNAANSYAVVNFLDMDLSFETSTDLYGFKKLIKRLYKEKVVNDQGEIDEEKAKRFAKKYDENISDRTVLIRN